MPGPDDIGRHSATHRAQPDEPNRFRHCGSPLPYVVVGAGSSGKGT
jgi:hypothetical protein